MATNFNGDTSFWFNKRISASIHPTESLYLTNGVDKKFRPIAIMRKMPRWPARFEKRQCASPGLLMHHYLTYLASLVPMKRLKNGLALIVDSNLFSKKQDVDHFKTFVSMDYTCKFYQLVVYCLLCNKHNLQSLPTLPSGIQVINVSCIAHLHRYILETQLPSQFEGSMTNQPEALMKFLKNFEQLELFISKDLNKYMMIQEHVREKIRRRGGGGSEGVDMGWMGGSYEDILWSYKTIKQSWSRKTLTECERILEKFKNPQKYFSSVMYNPAFQLASEKLYLYMAELLNFNNFYERQLSQMEHFLGVSTPSPVFKNNSPLSYRFSEKNSNTFTDSGASPKNTFKKTAIVTVSSIKLKNLSKERLEVAKNEGLSAKLSSILSKSTSQLTSKDPDEFSISHFSVPEAKNELEKVNRYTQSTLTRAKSDNVVNLFNDSDENDYLNGSGEQENIKNDSSLIKSNKPQTNFSNGNLNSFKREVLRKSLKKGPNQSPQRNVLNDEESLNETLDGIEQLYSWYSKALKLFDINITSKNCNKKVGSRLLEDVSLFVKNNSLDSKYLQSTQQAIPDIKEDNIKSDLNILIYRIYCLQKVLKNCEYLKLFELKEVLFWKEQYTAVNSKDALRQSFPDLMQLINYDKNPSKDYILRHEINGNSLKSSERSGKPIESYLINKTHLNTNNNSIRNKQKSSGTNKPHQNSTHDLNLSFKDLDFDDLIASIYKSIPEKSSENVVEDDELMGHVSDNRAASPFHERLFNPSGFDEDSLFKNPIYTSNSSSDDKTPTIDLTIDPLEIADFHEAVGGDDTLVISKRIQHMNSLLEKYDNEKWRKKAMMGGEERVSMTPENQIERRHPPFTPPSYDSVVRTDPQWYSKGSDESGFWTINSAESKIPI